MKIKVFVFVLLIAGSLKGHSQKKPTTFMLGSGAFYNPFYKSIGSNLQFGVRVRDNARLGLSYVFGFYNEEDFGQSIPKSTGQLTVHGQFFLPFEKWKPYSLIGASFESDEAFITPAYSRILMGLGLEYRRKIWAPYVETSCTFKISETNVYPRLEAGVRVLLTTKEKENEKISK